MHNPDRQLNTVGAAENTMTTIEALTIILLDLSIFFVPLCLLGMFFECTKIGRRIVDWVLCVLDLDDYDDDEDYDA